MDKQSKVTNLTGEVTNRPQKVDMGDHAVQGGPQRALSILPKKVWRQVFSHLKDDPKSLQSLSETCHSFHRLLTELEAPSRWESRVQEISTLVQTWRWYLANWTTNLRMITLDSDQALVEIDTCLVSLFWWRRYLINQVLIKLPSQGTPDQYTDYLADCLELVPLLQDKLTKMTIILCSSCPFGSYIDGYKLISKVLGTLPKLENLSISSYYANCSEDKVDELNGHWMYHKLPSVRNLTTLELLGYDYLPLAYLLELGRRYGGILKHLKINHPFKPEPEEAIFPSLQFPVLESLQLKLSWKFIQPIMLIKASQLSSLGLVINGDETCPLDKLFKILDNFPEIEGLRLDLQINPRLDHSEALQRFKDKRYPKVKYLCVQRWGYQVPLEYFAKLFPNLVEWSVGASMEENLQKDKRVEEDPDLRLILEESLEESGLWRRLPSLERITTYFPAGPKVYQGPIPFWEERRVQIKEYWRPEEFGGKGEGRGWTKWILGVKQWTVVAEVGFVLVACLVALIALWV